MVLLRIFLSHSHKDNPWCEVFALELSKHNIQVWYDRDATDVDFQRFEETAQALRN